MSIARRGSACSESNPTTDASLFASDERERKREELRLCICIRKSALFIELSFFFHTRLSERCCCHERRRMCERGVTGNGIH